jgi:lipoprotein-anchoring transpeptidase ErfK/SrfK
MRSKIVSSRLVAFLVAPTLATALGAGVALAEPFAYYGGSPFPDPAYPASAPDFLEELLGDGGDPYAYYATPEPPRAQREARQASPLETAPSYAPDLAPAYTPEYMPEAETARHAIDPNFMRAEVDYPTREAPGTLVVDTPERCLYYVKGNGRAIRYGIGVGRPGFEWSGVKAISAKAEWPAWTPPAEMLKRRPDLPRHMRGGPDNPLGARALYLGSSLYRIHGTNEPDTIGQNVSSGCIRMMNDDVVDLYDRVRVGARVVVR